MDSNRKVFNRKSSKTALKNNIFEYCRNSSVHGLQYLGEKERPCYEKLFWLLVIFSSLIFCGFMISEVYNRWNTSPVIVNFSEKPTSIWQIPFPAITVCPMTMVNQQIYNYTKAVYFQEYLSELENITNIEHFNLIQLATEIFEYTVQICFLKPTWIQNNMYLKNYWRFLQHLTTVSTNFFETTFCLFLQNEYTTCEQYFHEMLTSDGICYTFNGFDGQEVYRVENINEDFFYYTPQRESQWSLEEGYENDNMSLYPRRVTTATKFSGLEMTLVSFLNQQDYFCQGPYEGYEIFIHNPGDIPQFSDRRISLPHGQSVSISVKPQMMETSEQLRNYSPDRRQCYFSNERYLRFFKIYTQSNCMTECFANYTIQRCNCAFFSLPRPSGTKVCGASIEVIKCVLTAKLDYLKPSKENSIAGNCGCLPSCTSLSYDVDLSYSDWKNDEYMHALGKEKTSNVSRVSHLEILFNEAQFLTMKRYELYGPIDFLANCGGLLGLFMGVSMLSFIELLYFCSLRLMSNNIPRAGGSQCEDDGGEKIKANHERQSVE